MNNKKIFELEDKIKYHQNLYYNSTAEISDAEFDKLIDELKNLDPSNPVLKLVGAQVEIGRKWKKTKHVIPMGSLSKTPLEDFEDVFEKYQGPFVITEKYDGISIELIYKNGFLVQAITRGDGELGEDILTNVLKMKNVKNKINKFSGSLRGEIVMLKSDFDIVNSKGFDFANPRNAASGIAKGYDGINCEYLTIKYFDVIGNGNDFIVEHNKFEFLQMQGLTPAGYIVKSIFKIVTSFKELKEYYKWFIPIREKLNYQIDGLVVTIDNIKLQKELGFLNMRPKFSWVLKFPAVEKNTILKYVEWNTTRTGRVNPKAVLDLVEIDGTIVGYATLHNIEYIDKLNLYEGDVVTVKKAGDIIPAVISARRSSTTGKKISAPVQCPSCKEKLEIVGAYLVCSNPNCSKKNFEQLKHFLQVLELDGFAGGSLEKVFDAGLAETPIDLFSITKEQLIKLDGIGSGSADNFLSELKEKSKLPLNKFLVSFGADGLGNHNSEILATYINKNYENFEEFVTSSDKKWKELFTEETAAKISSFINANLKIILILLEKMTIEKKKSASDKLKGMSFCITGTLVFGKRDDYIKLIKENAGDYKSSVVKGLTYLVTNDTESGSSKNKKAKEVGTKIISEKELQEMMK